MHVNFVVCVWTQILCNARVITLIIITVVPLIKCTCVIIYYYWHIVDCGVPPVNNGVTLTFNSTLEGSHLLFWCDESPNETMTASCLSDGRWSIDTGQYSCTTKGKPCIFQLRLQDQYMQA